MEKAESLKDFYRRVPSANPFGLSENNAGEGHFNVYSRSSCSIITPYSRRDFYKISLIIGTGTMHYADKWITIDKPALICSNPLVPYSWEAASDVQEGWFCLFSESFLLPGGRHGILQDNPLFKVGSAPVFFVTEEQQEELSAIYRKMMREIVSDYPYKYSMLRNYLHLIIHEALKMQPTSRFEKHTNASDRITTLFLELLERQFPIDAPEAPLLLKTPNDYARNLSVHVNHLNRSVKEVTGRTTSDHIAARVAREATALLQHTDWNISEIAYGLGFEYPAYFTTFFRKRTGSAPNAMRKAMI